jgi:hypothetical protein
VRPSNRPMQTTMTITIVTAQGRGNAGRRKTCARASTESEVATWGTTAHECALQRTHPRARPKTRGVRLAISMSRMVDTSATIYPRWLGEGVDQPAPISQLCQGMICNDAPSFGAGSRTLGTTRIVAGWCGTTPEARLAPLSLGGVPERNSVTNYYPYKPMI